jgi:hypothetical protein
MKRIIVAICLLTTTASAQPAQPPAVEAWQLLYHREANQHAADMAAAIQQINDLQRQLADLKAKADPAAKPAP